MKFYDPNGDKLIAPPDGVPVFEREEDEGERVAHLYVEYNIARDVAPTR